ncbi:MAG: NAD(P)-dependent alcohol dehydrogenase [Solirubrobacterales bacterium]|nr:NAD(P)-dependent alcohol dehydrogenase [Solirubrobacterales bacterium]
MTATAATTTMKSFVFDGLNKVAVVDREVPRPGPNDAVVKTTAALICTSDIHTVRGALPVEHGRALGHEAVGVVHELGSAVEGFEVGQRVLSAATTPCLQCHPCQRGYTSQCQGALGAYKFTVQRDGNMAEYFLVNDAVGNLTAIPDDVADEQAVYAPDMLTTGFAGAEHAELEIGDTVVVFAQGAVGLCATMGCKLRGAGLIITVESIPRRQELSRRFGADIVVDHTAGDTVGQIMELTGGEGVDAAIEAFGFPQTWEAALYVTKPGGRVSNIGYHGEVAEPLKVPLDAFGLGMADKQIWGGLCPGGSERMHRLLRLLQSGKIDPTPMTTHEFGFHEIEKAFRMMENKEDGMIKPLIRF